MARKKSKTLKMKGASSDSFVTNGGVSILIGTIGLLVAFAVVWWQLVFQPLQLQQDAARDRALDKFSEFYNARITELRATVGAMATAPHTVAAMRTYDAQRWQELADRLVATHPHVVRIELIEKGRAQVDLNAEFPISFAALDLIRRAETREFVGPEVSLNQRNLAYAAQPITPDGVVAGVMLVVFDTSYFVEPLQQFTTLRGALKIMQSFEGSPSQAVISLGSASNLRPPVEKQLFAPHWTLSYEAPRDDAPIADSAGVLLVPLLVAWAILVGGIYIGFKAYGRKVASDAESLTELASRLVRGRPAQPGRMQLDVMQQAANSITMASGAKPSAKSNAQAEDTDEVDADDLLQAAAAVETAERANNKSQTKAKEEDQSLSDDFLQVDKSKAQDNFGIEVSEDVSPADMGLELDPTIFRAYDIRGVTTDNLTEDVVYWVGRAFAAQALSENQNRACVGWDGRHSSDPLQQSLIRGLTEGGMDVLSIGMVPTPMLYYSTYALETGTGIMITGSHNPPEYNGLKMMIAGTTLAEDAIQVLKHRLLNNELSTGEGDVEHIELDDSYVDRMLEDVAVAMPPKVVVDCGNGVAGKIAPRLLREIGCEVIELYCEVDGDFPNHHPDPADPHTLEDLRTVVEAEQADIGLAFDGDGDRLGVVTNSGEIIWPDKMIMLFAKDIVGRNPGADIIYDVKCSRHLNSIISDLGGRPIMWKTGHSHIKAKLKETGALLGGEFSGHIAFGERWYGFDDALYSAVRLLEILGAEGLSADELFGQFPHTFTTPEIKINTTDEAKFEIMERLIAGTDFGDGTVTTIDGVRVDYSEGWGLIRPSNTSPVLTLRFEADNPEALESIQDEFQKHLLAVDPALKFR